MAGILQIPGLANDVEDAMKQIADIFAQRNELDVAAIKKKVRDPCESLLRCQYTIKQLPPPDTIRDSVASKCCNAIIFRTLASVNQITEEKENCRGFLVHTISELESIEKGCELFLLETLLYYGAILLQLKKIKEAKKVLTKTKFLYDKCRVEKSDDEMLSGDETSIYYFLYFQMLEVLLLAKPDPIVNDLVNLMHVALLRNYEQYYSELDQTQKMGHYGCLVLKYTLQYDCYSLETWIEHAIDLTAYCDEYKAFAQSNYLLCAASVLLDHERDNLRKEGFGPETIERTNVCRYLQGRIALGFAQHFLIILYETKNRMFLTEKVNHGHDLTEEDTKDMQICIDVVLFEHLPKKITDRDEVFEKICANEKDIQKVYAKAREYMKEATDVLTESERESNGYPLIAQKFDSMVEVYPFLM